MSEDRGSLLLEHGSLDRRPAVRVGVMSEQSMVVESVHAALRARGIDAIVMRWPGRPGRAGRADVPGSAAVLPLERPARILRRRPLPQVALLLSSLDGHEQAHAVRRLVREVPVPWVVLSTRPCGPAWGAALSAGAVAVAPGWASLTGIVALLHDLVEDREAMGEERRQDLIAQWERACQEVESVRLRLGTLTQREREVLALLAGGEAVRAIAVAGGVAETTVRSQVRAILRKLEVTTQLAAVALLRQVPDSPEDAREPLV